VSDRDAFGREKGEDSLAEMGWVTNFKDAPPVAPKPPPPAPPEPTAVMPAPAPGFQTPPPPPAVTPPSPGFQAPQYNAPRRGRTRPRGRFPFKLVFLLIVAGCVWAFNVPQRIKDEVDKTTNSIQNAVPRVPSATPGSAAHGSLLSRSGLTAALRQVPHGRLEMIRVAPDNVTATVRTDGKLVVTIVTADGHVVHSTSTGGASSKTLKVDASAPARMIRAGRRLTHESARDVDYLVSLADGDRQVWLLYYKDGTHVQGDAHGRHVQGQAPPH
jgi:hypothetical protein